VAHPAVGADSAAAVISVAAVPEVIGKYVFVF
jgi:hypothetical protein